AFNTDVAKSWIDLVDCEIFDWNGAIDPFHVFAFRIKADFVVSATAKAALGIGWTNEAASTNTFNFLLFHEGYSAKKTTSEADNANRFDAYLFGSIGLSAGVRVKLAAGLFDARLDAIGFVVDGGAYINLNGFVYISYEQLGEKKAKWSSCGGMYVDAGLFYMITFVAEMIDGKIGYEKVIESNNYPIFEFGSPNIPLDFAYSQDKKESTEYNLKFKSPDKIAVMQESVFEMKMMDLTDGSVSNLKVGDDDLRKNFEITFDNPALSYDYSDGKHLIRIDYSKRGEKDEGTTTMTIRWKGSSFLQMTSEVERKIKFNWVCDNVSLQFLNRDGSTHCLISKRKGEPITEDEWPKNPTARGYQFTGWVDADGNAVSTPLSVMPGDDMVFTSTWSEKPTTLYVEYSYPLWDDKGSIPYYSDTDEITGICKVGDSIDNIIELLKQKNLLKTEKGYSFEGKTALLRYEPKLSDGVLSGTVDDDGTARFRIVLKFKKYTVRYVVDENNTESKQCVIGSHIEFPQVSKQGYNFLGWQDSEGNMVNSYDLPVCNGPETFKAVWEKKKATLTATAKLKVKRGWTVGMYSWKNIKTVEMTFDSYEVSVDEVLKRLNTGYTYCTYYNTYPKGSTIKLNEDGSTAVTFYFE
ncbi:MAG: InlB B-repeat-containing protein, partial [Clostridia bacterium]|nr:InlB B-repeat-containing protein [Clostridia bacterium]